MARIAVQEFIELRAMIGMLQMNRLVIEDKIQDILRRSLQLARQADGPVHRGAGTPSFVHRTPGDASGA